MVSFLRRRNFSTSEAVSRRPFGLQGHQSMEQQKKNWYGTKIRIWKIANPELLKIIRVLNCPENQ